MKTKKAETDLVVVAEDDGNRNSSVGREMGEDQCGRGSIPRRVKIFLYTT
jgi:hypothetical protein